MDVDTKSPARDTTDTGLISDSDLQQAIRLHREGKLEPALAIYQQLVDRTPPDARIVSLLGQLQLQLGQTAPGIDSLQRSVELAPDDARVNLALVRGLATAGRAEEAGVKARALLERDGNNAETWAALAAVQRHLGEHRVELQALQRAIALAPDDVPILIALANAQATNDDIDSAIGTLERAAALAPDNARIQNNLGALHLRRNRPDDAIEALQRALQIHPDYPTAAANLATAFHSAGRLEAAREAAEHAVGLAPGTAEPRAELASILLSMGDLAGAGAAYRVALEAAPGNQRVLAGQAGLLDRQGKPEAGLALLNEMLRSGKALPDTRLVAASLARRVGRREMALDYLRPLQDSTGDPVAALDTGHRRRLCFLLGDIYDGSADFGTALRYYDQANACANPAFDADGFYHFVDRIINEYGDSPEPSILPRDPRRIFIVGMPRNGAGLLESMLARHADVHACGELTLLRSLLRERGFPDTALTESDALQLGDLYCSGATAPAQARVVTDRMPLNFLYLGAIAKIMPDALIIHCERDPRDTLLSCYFRDFLDPALAFSSKLDDLSHYWRNYHRLMRHWQEVMPEMIIPVQYEDLVRDPGFVMQPLLESLGLDWDDAVLDVKKSDGHPGSVANAQVGGAIHQRSVGRFARYRPFLGDRAEVFDALT